LAGLSLTQIVIPINPQEVNLKIIVCIKQVPDSAARIVVEGGKISWGDAPVVMNPWDEYAVEAALVQKDAGDADVTVISIGAESAKEALKTALAMGCTEAVLISDPALAGADSQALARTLAAAIQKLGPADLVFFGRQAIDTDLGVTAAQTARALGWPALTLVSKIDSLDGNRIKVERSTDEGRQVLEGKLPVVLSVGKDIGEPRYPSFMGIRKAAKAVIPTWGLADLGISPPQSHVRWPELMSPPSREVTTEIITGGSPQEIAAKLAEKILAEKVL
jgi:electron transfer flavoprotein beta subunit